MQNTDPLVMEDAHSQSMLSTLTSCAGCDRIGQLSTTWIAGGVYSPDVGAFVDPARLLEPSARRETSTLLPLLYPGRAS
jgi:hypothetical protein